VQQFWIGWRNSSRHPLENNVWWIGDQQMLETPQERIKLLRAGFTSKTIDKLYIEGNNFKLVRFPVIVDLAEFDAES
jgi:hypothetical protein